MPRRWLGFRLDCLVSVLATVAPLLVMAVHSRLSSELVGLALTQALQLGGLRQWMVRQSAEVETTMTSVERMLAYTALPQVRRLRIVELHTRCGKPGWS